MSQSSKRSYEERTSSYKRNFGDGPGRFTYTSATPRNASSSSRVYRYSSSSGGGNLIEPMRASTSSSRIRVSRSCPVGSGVSMQDINMMSDALGPEFQGMRVNEKEELKVLNSRFAGYIQKVRALEQANKVLEAQVDQLNSSQPSRLNDMCDDEISRLRREIDSLTNQKSNVQLQLDNATTEAAKWKQKYDEEAANSRELESDLNDMRKDCDDATLVRLDLERRLETLQEEIEFLKSVHDQEIAELQDQIRRSDIKVETVPPPDLEELLQDMRTQYEKVSAKNRSDAEQWYAEKVEALQEQSSRNDDQMRQVRSEISEYRKTVQTLNLEIDSLRGSNDSLQRTLSELEQRYNHEVKDYQDTIDSLQNECEGMKAQMGQQLKQYQELMDVKMALDIEIATYRKLLEGEETRLTEKINAVQTDGVRSGYRAVSRANHTLNPTTSSEDLETVTTKKVVVKTIETKDGKVISQTEDIREHSTGDFDNETHHPTL